MYKITYRISSLLIKALICLLIPFCVTAKETINWYNISFPPATIVTGKYQGKGMNDMILKLSIEKLPEYSHSMKTANTKRVLTKFKIETNACSGALIKNAEREKIAYFSVPEVITISHRLITLTSKAKVFESYIHSSDKSISLDYLLKSHQELRLGIADRSYGEKLDTIITKYKGQKNVYMRSGEDISMGILEMLNRKRIDYIIEYPFIVIYTWREKGFSRKPHSIPLKETVGYPMGYIGCSKTEFGRQIINKINTVLKQEKSTERYLGYIEKWLDKSSVQMLRESGYEDVFLK